jgi:hypothetical protein
MAMKKDAPKIPVGYWMREGDVKHVPPLAPGLCSGCDQQGAEDALNETANALLKRGYRHPGVVNGALGVAISVALVHFDDERAERFLTEQIAEHFKNFRADGYRRSDA